MTDTAAKITEKNVLLPQWLFAALIMGAFVLGTYAFIIRDHSISIEKISTDLKKHELQDGHTTTLNKVSHNEKSIHRLEYNQENTTKVLQSIKENMVAVCQATNAKCSRD